MSTRKTKTPQQRAEDALGVAQRAVERLEKERTKHQAALDALAPQIEGAEKRLAYVAASPDLQQEPPKDDNPGVTTTRPAGT